MKTALESLRSVLCGPDGKCCIAGSDADRKIVDEALASIEGAMAPLWTDKRVEQLTLLSSLLREASSLDSASGVSHRIQRIVKLASALEQLDLLSDEPASFIHFLRELCIMSRSR